jgi:hypothetical protein
VRNHTTTQTALNTHKQGYKTSGKAPALGVLRKEVLRVNVLLRGRGLPSKGEARAPHHRPCPSIDLDHALHGALLSLLSLGRGGARNYDKS